MGAVRGSDQSEVVAADLRTQLDKLRTQREEIDEQILRYELALDALTGPPPSRRSPSSRKAVLAALATFTVPVRTEDLLDHDSLVHYSRHTLRSALADLRRTGDINGERAPKGFIWDPTSVRLSRDGG